MVRSIPPILLGVVAALFPARSFADEGKASQTAEEVATNFARAVEDKNLDGLLKLVETPWLDGGKSVIKDRGELRKHLEKKLERRKDGEKVNTEALQVTPWDKVRETFGEADRKLGDEVLREGGRVVYFGREGKEGALFVRVRDGQAAVVGTSGDFSALR